MNYRRSVQFGWNPRRLLLLFWNFFQTAVLSQNLKMFLLITLFTVTNLALDLVRLFCVFNVLRPFQPKGENDCYSIILEFYMNWILQCNRIWIIEEVCNSTKIHAACFSVFEISFNQQFLVKIFKMFLLITLFYSSLFNPRFGEIHTCVFNF